MASTRAASTTCNPGGVPLKSMSAEETEGVDPPTSTRAVSVACVPRGAYH